MWRQSRAISFLRSPYCITESVSAEKKNVYDFDIIQRGESLYEDKLTFLLAVFVYV